MGGVRQEQYNIQASQQRWARGTRHEPLRYGLKPGRYRVLHFGHSTQCRIRDAMMHCKTLAKSMPASWTFADLDPIALDISGPRPCSRDELPIGVRKRPSSTATSTMMGRHRYESGLAGLFPGAAVTRSALRRQILYWSDRQQGLLPSDLSRSYRERKKRTLFSERGGCSRSRLSPLPPLPSREFAGDTGLAGNFQHRLKSSPPDRGKRP